ncbi:MAG: hypothetical protein V4719_06435 [Planctomycetota bacterium]
MIELSRQQVRSVRTTLRQSLGLTSARRPPVVTFQGTSDALLIRAINETTAVEHHVSGNYPAVSFALPYEALTACEGRQNDLVRFEQDGDLVTLHWSDAEIPQSAQFAVSEPSPMPEAPDNLVSINRQFLAAMADACDTTETDSTRYALNCIRLRGTDGQIAATDGLQALVQSGYEFPWAEEVLVPASGAFTAKSLRDAQEVSIGKSPDWLFVRAGTWTFALKIEKDRRFPAIDSQMPHVMAGTTTMVLAEQDAEFLMRAASRLPNSDLGNAPITVDLNGAVVIRAMAAEQQSPTDLILRNSRRVGAELKVSSNRRFLQRAIQLGFREIHLRDVEDPAFCRDHRRNYLWALLGKDNVLQPDTTAIRIESPTISCPTRRTSAKPRPAQRVSSETTDATRDRISMTTPQSKLISPTTAESNRPDSETLASLIEEGESLRGTLREVLAQATGLVNGLKRQRRQSNLMWAALKSLRAVHAIDS